MRIGQARLFRPGDKHLGHAHYPVLSSFTVRGGGADHHDQGKDHWIHDHVPTPMARYPEYRQSRQSFGIHVLGALVVGIKASDGTVSFAVTTGGEIGAFIVEQHWRVSSKASVSPTSRKCRTRCLSPRSTAGAKAW